MYMSMPKGLPIKLPEEFSNRSIFRYGIRNRPQAIQRKFAVAVSLKASSKIHVWLIGILLLIHAVRCCVPDVQHGLLDW
jgi:hypothetical protein